MRTFTNRPRVTYNPLDTMSVFAEDMNEIGQFMNDRPRQRFHITTNDVSPHVLITIPYSSTKLRYFKIIIFGQPSVGAADFLKMDFFAGYGNNGVYGVTDKFGLFVLSQNNNTSLSRFEILVTSENSLLKDWYGILEEVLVDD